MIQKLFGRLASARSFIFAAFALAMSTMSAFAEITVDTAKLTLPDGEVGKWHMPYLFFETIPTYNTFSGGVTPYTVRQKEGTTKTLPPGMSIYNSGGSGNYICAFSGTPTTAGYYEIEVTITDSSEPAQVAEAIYKVTIKEPALEVVSAKTTLPPTTQWYQTEIDLAGSVTGGKTPYTYAVTAEVGNALPAGLYLSSGGVISGKPSVYGDNLSFKITVSDSSTTPLSTNVTYTLSIAQPAPLSASTNLGRAPVGKEKIYNLTNTVSGGVPPYTFEKTSGSYPSGYDLVDGILSGTATVAGGPYLFTLKVTDDKGTFDSFEYSLETVEQTGFVDDDPDEPASGVQVNCRTLEGTYPRTCNLITTSASTVVWDSSWYYVTGDVTLSAGAIVSNKVSLILGEDATLTVVGANNKAGIAVLPGNTLTIYAQSAGAHVGKLVVTGGNGSAGIGGDHYASCGKVTIYGGDVTATGTGWSAGIGGGDDNQTVGGDVAVYGGKVTANGGHSQPGIGGGYSSSNDGTLTVGDNIVVKAGSNENPTTVLAHGANGAITLQHSSRQYYVIETSGPAPLTQTQNTLAAYTGEVAVFDLTTTVSGGTTPYTFALKSGSSLPAGFTLSGTTLTNASASVRGSFILTVSDNGTGDNAQNEEFTYTITVTPRPQPITYMDGESEVKGLTPSNYVEGVGAVLPVNPPKTDYTFAGWFTNSSLTGVSVTEISSEARGPQTFSG